MPKKKTTSKKAAPKLVKHSVDFNVVGLQHRLTQSTRRMMLAKINEGSPIFCRLEREPDNPVDENAVKVVIQEGSYKDMHIGYVPAVIADPLSLLLDFNELHDVLLSITGMDVDKGEAESTLQFMSEAGVSIKELRRKKA